MERQVEQAVQKKSASLQSSSSVSLLGGNQIAGGLHAATQRQQSVEQDVSNAMRLAASYASQFRKAGNNLVGQVSQITGVIWDEFKEMSTFEKILALLGTAVVVGAVSYFSWEVIGGNWPAISKFATEQGNKLALNVNDMVERLQNNPVIKALLSEFGRREENPNFNADIAKNVYEGFLACGYEDIVKKLLETLPILMAGAYMLKQDAIPNKDQESDDDDDEFAV